MRMPCAVGIVGMWIVGALAGYSAAAVMCLSKHTVVAAAAAIFHRAFTGFVP